MRSLADRPGGDAAAAAARLGEAAAPDPDRRTRPAARRKIADNALKFTERGLVDIRLDSERDEAGHGFVRFTVTDTGAGVSPQAAKQLFKPFSPGDTSYTRSKQGAGLSLAVAKRVVDQAGGRIGFENNPGEGAQFWFTLPVSGQAAFHSEGGGAQGETPVTAPYDMAILVFTPVANLAAQIANLLEPFGNRIAIATSPADAARRASRETFDAIVTQAADADLLAASPGVKAPIIAVLLRGDRAPATTEIVLRWPVTGDALYRAINAASVPRADGEAGGGGKELPAIDAVAFSTLERSVGVKTLIEILQCYVITAEELTNALAEATAADKWDEAARLAQDIVGAAGGLGLAAVTQAARRFAQVNREGQDAHELRNAAQLVVGEHVRTRQALSNLYPDVA
jgi:HPt (histidine-containing phosphotransfer) domain-containing protein